MDNEFNALDTYLIHYVTPQYGYTTGETQVVASSSQEAVNILRNIKPGVVIKVVKRVVLVEDWK